MAAQRSNLSLWDQANFALALFQTLIVVFLTLFTAPFRGTTGAREYRRHILYGVIRSYHERVSAKEIQYITPTDDEVYNSFAKARGFAPTVTYLPFEARIFWVGDKQAPKIFIFFHGGGFVYPIGTHLEILWSIKKSWGSDTAIAVLSYTLAPRAQYPVQLMQASGLLQFIMTDAKREPENVILGGDSAGGNLVLGLMSHLLHPHPSIEPVTLERPLRGAVLISPWGSFRCDTPAYHRHHYKDLLTAATLKEWAGYVMGNAKPDEYNQPFLASSEWWKNMNGVVSDLLIIAGADEVLVDDITAFAQTLQLSKPDLTLASFSGEAHEQAFLDLLIGETKESESLLALKAWLDSRM